MAVVIFSLITQGTDTVRFNYLRNNDYRKAKISPNIEIYRS